MKQVLLPVWAAGFMAMQGGSAGHWEAAIAEGTLAEIALAMCAVAGVCALAIALPILIVGLLWRRN